MSACRPGEPGEVCRGDDGNTGKGGPAGDLYRVTIVTAVLNNRAGLRRTLESIAARVLAENINPEPRSGRQERLENYVGRISATIDRTKKALITQPALGRGDVEFLLPENQAALVLLRTHGDAYGRYAARVGRFVPGLGKLV